MIMDNFNEKLNYETMKKTLSEQLTEQLQKGDKMSKVLDGLEIKPSGNNILVKPYVKNPYEKAEVRESGIILDDEAAKFQNPDSGEEETQQVGIVVGRVIEVGPDCKWVSPGDDIYYYFGSVVPIPFYRQGFQCIAEPRVLMILNIDLTLRFQKPSEWIDLSEIPEFIQGEDMNERIKKYLAYRKNGIIVDTNK